MSSHDAIRRRLLLLDAEIDTLTRAGTEDALKGAVANVRRDVSVIESELDTLATVAEDLVLDRERDAELRQIDELRGELERARSRVRDTTLAARRRVEASTASAFRHDLLQRHAQARTQNTATADKGDDELMNATADVTSSLRRTMQLMQQELDRSVQSNELLLSTTSTMALASDQHLTFSSALSASKALITSMERADVLDRILILAALTFFGLVCVYILKRRILDRGLHAAQVVGKLIPRKAAPSTTAGAGLATAVSPSEAVRATLASIIPLVTDSLSEVASAALPTNSILEADEPLSTTLVTTLAAIAGRVEL